MHQRLFSFLYLLQMQEAFFQNSSPLPVDILFSITINCSHVMALCFTHGRHARFASEEKET